MNINILGSRHLAQGFGLKAGRSELWWALHEFDHTAPEEKNGGPEKTLPGLQTMQTGVDLGRQAHSKA